MCVVFLKNYCLIFVGKQCGLYKFVIIEVNSVLHTERSQLNRKTPLSGYFWLNARCAVRECLCQSAGVAVRDNND